jgi:hypothetical protein
MYRIGQFAARFKGKHDQGDGRAMKDGHLPMTAFCRVRFRAQGPQHLTQMERVAFADNAPRRV